MPIGNTLDENGNPIFIVPTHIVEQRQREQSERDEREVARKQSLPDHIYAISPLGSKSINQYRVIQLTCTRCHKPVPQTITASSVETIEEMRRDTICQICYEQLADYAAYLRDPDSYRLVAHKHYVKGARCSQCYIVGFAGRNFVWLQCAYCGTINCHEDYIGKCP